MAAPTVRFSRLLCAPCQETLRDDAWTLDMSPVHAGHCRLSDVFPCPACRAGVRRGAATARVRGLTELSARQRERLTAVHEAGHAVLAIVTGQPVSRVELLLRRGQSGRQDVGGVTVFDGPIRVPLPEYVAICWAGQQASLRYLAAKGHATAANRLDVRHGGWDDNLGALAAIRRDAPGAEPLAAFLSWRALADALLEVHWPAVIRLQRKLLRARRLDLRGLLYAGGTRGALGVTPAAGDGQSGAGRDDRGDNQERDVVPEDDHRPGDSDAHRAA